MPPAAADNLPPDGHARSGDSFADENVSTGFAEPEKTNGHASHTLDVDSGSVAQASTPPAKSTPTQAIGITDANHVAESDLADALSVDGSSKKRKFDRLDKELTRKVSPPWKKVAAEGPTSFVVDGRRMSSRTNHLPLELQPPSDKRKTRAKQVGGTPRGHGTNGVRAGTGQSPLSRKSSSIRRGPGPERPMAMRESQKPKRASWSAAASKPVPKATSTPAASRSARTSRRFSHTSDNGEEHLANSTPRATRTGRTLRSLDATPPGPLKIRIRVGSPTFQQHPKHFPAPKLHENFSAWMAADDPFADEPTLLANAIPPIIQGSQQPQPHPKKLNLKKVARREALARLRLYKAAEPGGPLSEGVCTVYHASPQREPVPRWGTWDFITAHAINMHGLMRTELVKHKKMAALLARACMTEIYTPGPTIAGVATKSRWAFLQEAKSAEETWQEEYGYQVRRYKQLIKDVEAKWRLALFEVDKMREAAWEKEQEVQGNKVLDDLLGKSTMLLHKQFGDETTTPGSDSRRGSVTTLESGRDSAITSDQESNEEDDDSSNMSESEDEEDDDAGGEDLDAGLTQEELLAKYAALPDLPQESSDEEEDGSEMDMDADSLAGALNGTLTRDGTPTPTPDPELMEEEYKDVVIDEVDPILMDDEENDSPGMSDEDLTDEDPMSEQESEEDEEDVSGMYLASLFSETELVKLKAEQEARIKEEEDAEEVVEEIDEALREEEAEADEIAGATESPATDEPMITTSTTPRPSNDAQAAPSTRSTSVAVTSAGDGRVPISPLLRGTLREYQHDGVDWLAKLYAGNRNGILADEMGLGKTIQTIALLAHLATDHHVWGPHLIVVPTSVILNWEMEFKKWCPGFKILTYYGTIEERRAKRKGWTNDDLWNVCITSYQLIIQDAQAFKKRAWHYLVLDEAHNIKNFQSLRWQTLLTFKTNARLLLTGTPLQNNLQELWSLLYFLMPAGTDGAGGFADLEKFLNSMKKPADQILDQGLQQLDAEAQARVDKLHEILRPFLLRRLKSQVEKQMPGKYEHVISCRLSKRQRQLYDGFMGRADTRRTLSSGNYMSIINCLMSLRKVCNHPDLFETRQIVTSFAMQRSAVGTFEATESLVRKMLLSPQAKAAPKVNLGFVGLLPTREVRQRRHVKRLEQINAARKLEALARLEQDQLNKLVAETTNSVLTAMAIEAKRNVVSELLKRAAHMRHLLQRNAIYDQDLLDVVTLPKGSARFDPPKPTRKKVAAHTASYGEWYLDKCITLQSMLPTVEDLTTKLVPLVTKFGCVTPAVVAEDVVPLSLTPKGVEIVQLAQEAYPVRDPFHEARIRLSIAFPDKRLLQYDCGKLQALDQLLRGLQAGGHRCLIFTQMTKVLDILEQFLNIHGHRYLRLDGATKIEQRQILTDRFNNDDRILAFILSSRSGGLGINLTGADTVIFYDLDWNPAMDKQCQDRCHRIGQTRDVHIYRFVSEHTIEANILRKSNQKRLLDDVIIQKGEFTTDVFQDRVTYRDALGDLIDPATADGTEEGQAMDRVLGDIAGLNRVLDVVEDTEDVTAAKAAQKEVVVDEIDFTEAKSGGATTEAATPAVEQIEIEEVLEEGIDKEAKHVDEYLVRYLKDYEWYNVPFRPVVKQKPKKKGVEMGRRKR